jgi:ankyrin repeat protein/WD40 repeat protein
LVENPLLLRLVATALPRLLEKFDYESVLAEKHERIIYVPKFTRAHIYQAFIDDWFEREAQRYTEMTGELTIKLWDFKAIKVQRAFSRFCQRLSWEMLLKNQIDVNYQDEAGESSSESEEFEQDDENADYKLWKQFFTDQDPVIIKARIGCPLRFESGRFSYYHKSFHEYFASLRLFEESFSAKKIKVSDQRLLSSLKKSQLYINKKLLSNEPEIVAGLSELIRGKRELIERLLFFVRASRKDILGDFTCIASANSATILVKSQYNFSLCPLSDVNITGAKMTAGLLDSANFSGANLTSVDFNKAYLRRANFQNAMMRHVSMGEYPSVPFPLDDYNSLKTLYSFDGLRLIVLHNKTISVLDSESRKLIGSIDLKLESALHDMALLNSENSLGFCTKYEVGVVDLKLMRLVNSVNMGKDRIHSLDVSPDKSVIALASDIKIFLLNSQSLQIIDKLSVDESWLKKVMFSFDQKSIFTHNSRSLFIFSTETMEQKKSISYKNTHHGYTGFDNFCISDNGMFLVTVGSKLIDVWSLPNGDFLHTLDSSLDIDYFSSMCFYPKSNILIFQGQKTYFYDIIEKKLVAEFDQSRDDVVISKDGSMLVLTIKEALHFYPLNLSSPKNIQSKPLALLTLHSSPYGHLISEYKGNIHFRSSYHGEIEFQIKSGDKNIISLAISGNGEKLASLSDDSGLRIWNIKTREPEGCLRLSDSNYSKICLNYRGTQCIVWTNKIIELWDMISRNRLKVFRLQDDGEIEGVMFNASESTILFHNGHGLYGCSALLDESFKKLAQSSCEHFCLSVNPKSELVAFTGDDHSVTLLNLNDPDNSILLRHAYPNSVRGLSFNEAGTLLAMQINDITLFYDVNQMQTVATHRGLLGNIIWDGDNIIEVDYANIKYWKSAPIKGALQWYLEWRTSEEFEAAECQIENVIALSADNCALLIQHGAITQPNKVKPNPINDDIEIEHLQPIDIYSEYSLALLFTAVSTNHLPTVTDWLTTDNTNATNELGQNLLHVAQSRGAVELLVNQGANPNARDSDGCTPLHIAARAGFDFLINALLAAGGDINAKNNKDQTPLHIAVECDQEQFILELLSYTVDLEAIDVDVHTALHIACVGKNPSIMRKLIEAGANLEATDSRGLTPLLYALSKGNSRTGIIDGILDFKPNVCAVDIEGNGVFHLKTIGRCGVTDTRFSKFGADINSLNKNGTLPIQLAMIHGVDMFRQLLYLGADPDARDARGLNVWFGAVAFWGQISQIICHELSQYYGSANINARGFEGSTALHAAVYLTKPEALTLLLSYGADPSITNSAGMNCLHVAGHSDKPDLLEILLNNERARLLLDSKGGEDQRTALSQAAYHNKVKALRVLLKYHPQLEITDRESATALFLAIGFMENLECVRLLIDAGADINATNGKCYVIHRAIRSIDGNPVNLVNELIEKNVRLDVLDAEGLSVLHYASGLQNNAIEMITLLLSYNVEIHSRQAITQNTILHTAAINGQVDIVEFFIENRIELSLENAEGKTALTLAHEKGHDKIVLLLTSAGERMNIAPIPTSPRFFQPIQDPNTLQKSNLDLLEHQETIANEGSVKINNNEHFCSSSGEDKQFSLEESHANSN